ncbi:heme biosynthesis protein HemY [Paracoccaceae bacterium GXU_MW_L88]
MISTLIKILFFIGVALLAAFGLDYMLDQQGSIAVAFAGKEYVFTMLEAVIALAALGAVVWIAWKLAGLVLAVLHFLAGDETAISRYFARRRDRKGHEALRDSVIALAEGDGAKAKSEAAKAQKFLDQPELMHLIAAQAAERAGDHNSATEHYKALVKDDRTRFVGTRGLMQQQLQTGDKETAAKLAEKAAQMRPKHSETLNTLFELQTEQGNWEGARTTLKAQAAAMRLPKDVVNRRDAVLSTGAAMAARDAGVTETAQEAAKRANSLAPNLVPAAVMAAELAATNGNKQEATRVLKKAWGMNPHPALANAFAAIEPEETPEERRKRFQQLIKANSGNAESRMLEAELALAAEDFPAARRAIGKVAEDDPTTRSLSIMAAIDRGEGAPDHVVRGWLTKAMSASQGKQWVCNVTHKPQAEWAPLSQDGYFDSLEWTTPPRLDDAQAVSPAALMPLLEDSAAKAKADEDAEVIEVEQDDATAEAEETAKA